MVEVELIVGVHDLAAEGAGGADGVWEECAAGGVVGAAVASAVCAASGSFPLSAACGAEGSLPVYEGAALAEVFNHAAFLGGFVVR